MANRPSIDAVRPEPERVRGRASMGRGFTLLEIMIVMFVILILTSLVLGVGSALLKRAERSQVESAMSIMENAFGEWEAQTGRPITYNGSIDAAGAEIFPSGASAMQFDVIEPPAPTSNIARARGAGVYALNLLFQMQAIRPMLAGIAPGILRPEANSSTFPAANIKLGEPQILYMPSARTSAGLTASTRAELVDTWGGRIAFVFPGRAYRYGVDPDLPDSDGTVQTLVEKQLGVCTNRRICLVSAGPDGLFGVSEEFAPPNPTAMAAAAADNVYLYELDPPN